MSKRAEKDRKNCETIHIKRIEVDSGHIRRNITDIKPLRDTIADAGLLQPILVRQTERGYKVIDGARRLQALRELEVSELIIGRDVVVDPEETEADFTFKQLIANVQREDVNDIELGHAFVALKEKHGYAYKDVAVIIGKTPHYVAAKVGLAKRLMPEVQALAIKDWEAAKCIRNTLKCDSDDVLDPYVMNVNVIEDIARLPGEVQEAAYAAIKDKEMDKKEALRYLRMAKEEADDTCIQSFTGDERGLADKDVKRFIKKIDKDVERLSETVKSGGYAGQKELAVALESLIERLSMLYAEVKANEKNDKAVAAVK